MTDQGSNTLADSPKSFAQFAGKVLFPRALSDLTSTAQCPACFQKLASTVCSNCGLDLNHPESVKLAAISTDTAALLESRTELIGRIRFETAALIEEQAAERAAALARAQAEAATALAPPTPTIPAPQFAPPAAAQFAPPVAAQYASPAPQTVAAPVAAPTTPPATPTVTPPTGAAPVHTPPPRKRGSSVQVLVLIGGITLLSGAAIAFLVYAFINFGIEWRSAIIATFTVATFVVASLLRRRDFTSTAEGIAVFAVVLVYLDAFAVRANDLFGAGSSPLPVYWGATLLISAVGFILWHRLSGLRVANIAGFAAIAPGAGILAYGLGDGVLDTTVRLFIGFAVTALVGVIHPLAGRAATEKVPAHEGRPERIVVLAVSVIALVISAFIAVVVDERAFWGGTIALIVVAAIAAVHVLITVRSRSAGPVHHLGLVFAGIGGVAAAASFAPPVLRDAGIPYSLIAPALAAVIVTLALDLTANRLSANHPSAPAAKRAARTGSIAALAVGAFALIAPAGLAAVMTALTAASGATVRAWTLGAASLLEQPIPENLYAVIALAAVTAAFAAFAVIGGRLVQRRTALVALTAATAIAAAPLLTVLWGIVAAWLAIGAIGVVLAVARRTALSAPLRVIVLLAAGVSTFLGYLLSWASLDIWWAASLVTIALLIGARALFERTARWRRAALLAVAVVVGYIATTALAAAIPRWSASEIGRFTIDFPRFLGILAVALLLIATLARFTTLSRADRHTLFGMSLPLVIVTTLFVPAAVGSPAGPQPLLNDGAVALGISVAFLAALILWATLRDTVTFRVERVTSSVLLAPALYGVLHAITRVVEVPAIVASITPVAAGLLVAVGALVVAVQRPAGQTRWAMEAGIGIVALFALNLAAGESAHPVWLSLVIAGVTALFIAVSADGLFASSSLRKHFGWLALALATLGLWWRLRTDAQHALEPYVLPLAGALLLIALFVWRAHRRAADVEGSGSRAAPYIALGGLLVAVLPLAVSGATGAIERPIVVGILSAALLLGGSFIRGSAGLRPYLDVAAVAGGLGVLTVSAARANILAASSSPGIELDLWLGLAVIVLFAAAFGQTIARIGDQSRLRTTIGQAIGIAAMTALVLIGSASLRETEHGFVRAVTLVLMFAVLHAVALSVDRGPLRHILGWVALAYTVIVLTVGVVSGAITTTQLGALVIITALISSAIALLVTIRGWSATPRILRETGLAALGIVSVLLAVTSNNQLAWLVLVIAAVTALLLSISADGLFASGSARKHLGWLALALATGGLWWRLRGDEVSAVEPYVLPLAGALLLVALFTWRSQRTATTPAAGASAAPLIALGGLLVAILPISLNAATGTLERAVIIGAASAALLLVGSLVTARPGLRPYLDSAAVAGAVGVLVVAIGRAYFLSAGIGVADARLDAWLGAAFLALVIAAFGQSAAREGENSRVRSRVSQGLGILALGTVFLFAVGNLADSGVGQIRALAIVWLFAAVHVIAVAIDRVPLTRLLGWIALALAAATAVVGVAVGALDPIELASAPIALALLATGVIRLSRVPAARSWPTLGPGMLLLFVPSMLLTITDKPLWRLIAIAIVGIAAIVIGLRGRLQAPFLVGIVVTVVHGIATFSPQIREVYEAAGWLVWIIVGALGGILLTVLAARYEKSLKGARNTIRRVAELR